jgi:short-subunit dehydrogenase
MNIMIIGATSGIGKALFLNYAKHGCRIGIVGRRRNLLEVLRQQYPINTMAVMADITKTEESGLAISSIHESFGHIDMAIVCAGTGELNPSLNYSIERQAIDTNVTGWTFVVDTLYRLFERQGKGHLVAITSIGGLRGEPMAPAYSATKAYQINYMEALRKKAFKSGDKVSVTDIRPGLVDTSMAKGDHLFWVMPVEKVARQIIDKIRKKKTKAYVTKRWHILAIMNKNLPFTLYKRM